MNTKFEYKGLFSDKIFYQKLFALAIPIAFQSLMLALVAAADAFMLGSIEQNAMSAVSLATQIQFIQNMIVTSAIGTAAILGAQYWGKGDRKTLNDVLCITLRLSGIASILFFVACVFFPRYLMLIFTNEQVLIEIGIKYLKIAGWSYLLTGISQCYMALLKITEHAKTSAIISTVAVLLNIIFNAILIYGFFGFEAMGERGAAIATLIARIIEAILAVAITLKKGYITIDLRGIFKRNRLIFKDYIKIFWPILLASLIWGIGFTSYSAFMGHLGTDASAANSITSVIRDLVCCLCSGIASGGGILVGNELGAGKLDLAKTYGDRLCILSFLIGFLSTAIMLGVTPLALHFVKLTDGAKECLFGMMIVMAFYMIGRCVNSVIINGIFGAGGDTMFDMYTLIVCMWGIAIPLAFLGTFILNWSPVVVYACTCLDEIGKIPWVLAHYRKYKWVRNLTR